MNYKSSLAVLHSRVFRYWHRELYHQLPAVHPLRCGSQLKSGHNTLADRLIRGPVQCVLQ